MFYIKKIYEYLLKVEKYTFLRCILLPCARLNILRNLKLKRPQINLGEVALWLFVKLCVQLSFEGRGTSVLDGLSIAWSVIEHLHSSIKCRTLASTHYYQLAKLAHILPRVDSYHVTAIDSKDGLSFTYKVTVSKLSW